MSRGIVVSLLTVEYDSTCDKTVCDGDGVSELNAAQLLKKSCLR